MRELGTLASVDASTSRPAFFVVIHDAETLIPSAILSENLLLEELAGVVWFKTQAFEVDAILSNLKVRSTRPQEFGKGMIRREASFSILSNQNTSPYVNGALSKAIWSGGKSIDSVLFSIWGVDIASITSVESKDIDKGVCFGYFKLDSSTSWDEETRECPFNLIDVTISDDRVVAANSNSGVRALLSFNESYNSKVIPTVYGAVKRVKMLRGYPDISLLDSASYSQFFSGKVAADYNSGSTVLVLEQPSYDSSILRQLIASGTSSVRIRMQDDEVIAGNLAYDAGNNRVLLNVTARNTFYYTGKAYTEVLANRTSYDGQPKPGDYDTYQQYYQRLFALSWSPQKILLTDAITAYSGILWNTSEIAKNGYGYIKLHASFPGPDLSDQTVFAKLSMESAVLGTKDNKTPIAYLYIETDIGKGAYTTPTRYSYQPAYTTADDISQVAILSYNIYGTTVGIVPSVSYKDSANIEWFAGLRNATNKATPHDQIELYFKNPVLGAGSGTNGVTEWGIIHYDGAVSYNHYLNDGYTYVDSSTKIYGVGDDGLVQIPSQFIQAIERGVTEYGYSSLIRVKLSVPPTGMGLGFSTNDLFIDCSFRSGVGADRHRIMFELLNNSRLASFVADSNLNPNSYVGAPDTSIEVGFICSGETYSEVLDKLTFQLSEAFKWNTSGSIDWYSTINTSIDGAGLWTGEVVDAGDLYDNTSAIHLSKFKSVNLDANREALLYYLETSYGSWMDPFYVAIDSKDGIGLDEVYLRMHLDCIQSKNSAETCINNIKKLGSASGVCLSGRQIQLTGGIQQLAKYEPLDCALVNNYPSVTEDSDLSSIMHRSGNSIQYDLIAQNFILQGVCVLDSIEYSLSIDEVSVQVSAFICQKDVDARGIKLSDPPTKLGTIKIKETDEEPNSQNYLGGAAGGTGGSELPVGEKNTVLITDASEEAVWRELTDPVKGSVFAYDPVTEYIGWVISAGGNRALLIGDPDEAPYFGKIIGEFIDDTALPCISAIQLVDNNGDATNQVPGTSVLNNHSLFGTTLTFDCSELYNPVKIALSRNVTPDTGLVNGDDIEVSISLLHHSISSLHLVQMPAASIWCNPASVTADSAISVSAMDNTMLMRKSNVLVWDSIDTDQIKNSAISTDKLKTDAVTTIKIANLAVTGDKIDGGQIQNYHIVSLAWSKITGAPSSYTPAAHAAEHYANGDDPLSLPTENSILFAGATWLSGILNVYNVQAMVFQINGAAPQFCRLDKEIEIVTDNTPFTNTNHLQIKDNSIANGKIISVDWSKLTNVPSFTVTLGGDVTGPSGSNTVTKIQGYSVSNANPDTNSTNAGGSILVYSAVNDIWVPVKVFDNTNGTAADAVIQGGILVGVKYPDGTRTIGSIDGLSDTSTGYLLGIDTSLQTSYARPKWLRDVILGQGQGAASSTAGRMRIVCGTDGDYIDLGMAHSTARIAMFDRSVSTSTPMVDINLSELTPTGGWGITKKLKIKEITVYESGAQKHMLVLASDPY